MLTKQERAWLKKRPNYLDLTVSPYSPKFRKHAKTKEWLTLLYEFFAIHEKTKLFNEAGAFESRVAKCLSERIPDAYEYGMWAHDNGGKWGCFAPEPWDELKQARLKVEKEIENERLR